MLRVIDKKYLISSLKDFNEKVLSRIYSKIPANKSVLDKLDESDETLTFNGNKIGLKGDPGQDGKSAYEIAVENGFVGTETEWIESLHGTSIDDYTTIQGVLETNVNNNDFLFVQGIL